MNIGKQDFLRASKDTNAEVAARFSHERQLPETKGIKPFGFHYFLPEGTQL